MSAASLFQQGHLVTPHHGVGEGDPAAPHHGVGEGGPAADYHEERIDQGQSTPQGGREMGGFWLSDTRHLDPKVTGRETQREGVAVHTTGGGRDGGVLA